MVNPWFWSKNGHFSTLFFLGNIGQENVFYDILKPENAFQGYKNKKSKNSKYWHFFRPKMAIFPTFFFGNRGHEKVFYDILEQKTAFLGNKNKKFKKSKIWHFFTGVNPWFWSKNGHFSNFSFLGNICQENVLYNILKQKPFLF